MFFELRSLEVSSILCLLLAFSHQMGPCVVTCLCIYFIAPVHGGRRWGNGNEASKCSNDRGDEEDDVSTAAPTTEAGGFAEESTIGQDEPDESDTELLVVQPATLASAASAAVVVQPATPAAAASGPPNEPHCPTCMDNLTMLRSDRCLAAPQTYQG